MAVDCCFNHFRIKTSVLIYFVSGGKRDCNNETYRSPTRFGFVRRLRKQTILVS